MSFTYSPNSQTVIKTIDATTETVTIPNTITEILEDSLKSNNNVKTIIFEENSQLNKLSTRTFADSKLEKISFSKCKNLEIISKWCFYDCQYLSSIELPRNEKLNKLCEGAFYNNIALKYIFIPSTVEIIEDCSSDACAVFHGCRNLERCIFEANSKCYHFGSTAFFDCKSLTEFIFPPLVTYIPGYVFQNCCNLKSVCILAKNLKINNNAFATVNESIENIYVMGQGKRRMISKSCLVPIEKISIIPSFITCKRRQTICSGMQLLLHTIILSR